MMTDNFEKLNQLLEQEQCEFVGIPDGFTGQTADGNLRMIYLMNDAVESFLILTNARVTGQYKSGYEGPLGASLETQDDGYVLAVHQGDSAFAVFFDDLLMEKQLYNYGSIGHFWVKKYENLRVLEYQIAILRDKYDYLGEEFCTQQEKELAMLRDFPPLNYLFYAAVPVKYIVPVDNPWEVTEEAWEVMRRLAEEAGDETLIKILLRYRQNPGSRNAAKIARMLHQNNHLKTVNLLTDRIREAASVYPDRDFGPEQNRYLQGLLENAQNRKKELAQRGIEAVIYKEEPFIYDCDSLDFKVCLLTVRKGLRNQRVELEFFPVYSKFSV